MYHRATIAQCLLLQHSQKTFAPPRARPPQRAHQNGATLQCPCRTPTPRARAKGPQPRFGVAAIYLGLRHTVPTRDPEPQGPREGDLRCSAVIPSRPCRAITLSRPGREISGAPLSPTKMLTISIPCRGAGKSSRRRRPREQTKIFGVSSESDDAFNDVSRKGALV